MDADAVMLMFTIVVARVWGALASFDDGVAEERRYRWSDPGCVYGFLGISRIGRNGGAGATGRTEFILPNLWFPLGARSF